MTQGTMVSELVEPKQHFMLSQIYQPSPNSDCSMCSSYNENFDDYNQDEDPGGTGHGDDSYSDADPGL